jgi:hypothetical protein
VYYAVLDEPVRDHSADPARFSPQRCGEDSQGRFVWVSDMVLRPAVAGSEPHHGMRDFPVEIAYVFDPALRGSETLDPADLDFIAGGVISDADVSPRRPLIDLPPLADELADQLDPDDADGFPVVVAQPATPIPLESPVERPAPERTLEGVWQPDLDPGEELRIKPALPAAAAPVTPTAPIQAGPEPAARPVPPADLTANPRSRGRLLALTGAGLAAAALIGVIAWAAGTTEQESPAARPPTTTVAASPQTPEPPRLIAPTAGPGEVLRVIPDGYPDGACAPEPAVPVGTRAAVTCGLNTDPDGPPRARYALLTDRAALDQQFEAIVAATRQQTCPGRIQSPGPWKRNATPTKVEGTLYCGVRDNKIPLIAWTDAPRLLLSEVDSPVGAEEATFRWWSSHS